IPRPTKIKSEAVVQPTSHRHVFVVGSSLGALLLCRYFAANRINRKMTRPAVRKPITSRQMNRKSSCPAYAPAVAGHDGGPVTYAFLLRIERNPINNAEPRSTASDTHRTRRIASAATVPS